MLQAVMDGPDDVPAATRAEARLMHAWMEMDRSNLTMSQARRIIAGEMRAAARAGYHRVLSRAWSMMAVIYQNGLDADRAERAYRRAARQAALAGDAEYEADMLLDLVGVGVRSRMPVSDVIAVLDRAMTTANLSHAQEVRGEQARAYLFALQGRFDEARELMVGAIREAEERGRVENLTGALITFGLIEFFAEAYGAAREHMTASRDIAEAAGMRAWSAFMSARLAHLLMLEGKDDEALASAELARAALVGPKPTDPWMRMFVAGAEARIMARRGETAEALMRARGMVADAEAAGFEEFPAIFAPALEDLAEVLAADGQTQEACEVLGRVIAMQRAKENLAGLAKAERALARIAGD